MSQQSAMRLAVLLCLTASIAGCGGEKGAKVRGVLLEDGQPLRVAEKEGVILSLVPTQPDPESVKAQPGADFNRADSTFTFVGPGLGLVPPGEYKVCLTVRMREGEDRFGGAFALDKTPLTYVVTDDPEQEIVIDLTRKTVTRR
jgi:hypothetical protein